MAAGCNCTQAAGVVGDPVPVKVTWEPDSRDSAQFSPVRPNINGSHIEPFPALILS